MREGGWGKGDTMCCVNGHKNLPCPLEVFKNGWMQETKCWKAKRLCCEWVAAKRWKREWSCACSHSFCSCAHGVVVCTVVYSCYVCCSHLHLLISPQLIFSFLCFPVFFLFPFSDLCSFPPSFFFLFIFHFLTFQKRLCFASFLLTTDN